MMLDLAANQTHVYLGYVSNLTQTHACLGPASSWTQGHRVWQLAKLMSAQA
jgi:hypothetical protein